MATPFGVADVTRCAEIPLTNISPKAFKIVAHEGMQRSLARRIVEEEASEGSASCRLAYEPFRGMLASKRIHPRDAGCMRALFCGGTWTNTEKAACWYADSDRCELCGGADSVRGRLWLCAYPEVAAARQAAL